MNYLENFDTSTLARLTNQSLLSTQSNERFKSSRVYIDYLFKKYARLLVIRLDFGFRMGSDLRSNLWACRNCFNRLLNNQSHNSLFDHQVGYIWCLEFGEEKGWHYHCLFFFDGSKSRQDVTYGDAIGEYWHKVITKGEGTYWSCNRDKDSFEWQNTLGVGMVHYSEIAKRENLLVAASYLCKTDPYLKLLLPEDMKSMRTFGRGEISQNESKMGRPRQGLVGSR